MSNNIRKNSQRNHTIKKHGKKNNIKSLHGALKNLLNKQKLPNHLSKDKNPQNRKTHHHHTNDIIYIRSKENILIPKLSDDEVMERHKKADENMKNVWSNIISKYEQMDDSKGDLIDLNSGEIIEDNGHVRELSQLNSTLQDSRTIYKSTFNDIFPEQNDEENHITTEGQADDDAEDLNDSIHDEDNSVWADPDSDANYSDTSNSDTSNSDLPEQQQDEERGNDDNIRS